MLEAAAKQVDDYAIGDVLEVETADGETVELRVAGFAHDINAVPAQFVGFETGYVSFGAMQDLGEELEYNQLSLDASPTRTSRGTRRLASSVDLREELFDSRGVQVYYTDVPEPGSHFLGDIFNALSLLLLFLGALALGLSAFLVVNTVSALMSQQVRQVGIMKAVGGRAGQLERLYTVTVTMYGAARVRRRSAAGGGRHAVVQRLRRRDPELPGDELRAADVGGARGARRRHAGAARSPPPGPIRRGVKMSVVRALNAGSMTAAQLRSRTGRPRARDDPRTAPAGGALAAQHVPAQGASRAHALHARRSPRRW